MHDKTDSVLLNTFETNNLTHCPFHINTMPLSSKSRVMLEGHLSLGSGDILVMISLSNVSPFRLRHVIVFICVLFHMSTLGEIRYILYE